MPSETPLAAQLIDAVLEAADALATPQTHDSADTNEQLIIGVIRTALKWRAAGSPKAGVEIAALKEQLAAAERERHSARVAWETTAERLGDAHAFWLRGILRDVREIVAVEDSGENGELIRRVDAALAEKDGENP